VPTLSRWKLLLLAALLGGAAMHALATVMENSARTTIRRLPPAGGTASGEVPCPARVRGRWADRSPSPSAACTRRTTRRCPPESPATPRRPPAIASRDHATLGAATRISRASSARNPGRPLAPAPTA
jgi:hypothetical protein